MSHPLSEVADQKRLPDAFRSFFWDCDFSSLSWEDHRDYIIKRILTHGDWNSVRWLRVRLGDTALRRWIEENGGGGMDPRQLRFWGLILRIPEPTVDAWVEAAQQSIWGRRTEP